MDTGGSAFPEGNWNRDNQEWEPPMGGMTLRDWFAGKALSAMMTSDWFTRDLAKAVIAETSEETEQRRMMHAILARRAYMLADAMLLAQKDKRP